ncbi:MAG TPA: ATP-binding protein [bacterium]|nr:ATP-binding protein [bacterium]
MKDVEKKGKSEYSIEVPRQEKYFFLIRSFLENVLSVEGVDEKERDDVVLAVNEACDKLFRRGDTNEKMKIDISLKVTPKKTVIVLHRKRSQAQPVDFGKVDEDRIVLEAVKNKIGDYLIEKSADEVSYMLSKKKGDQLKITKLRGK